MSMSYVVEPSSSLPTGVLPRKAHFVLVARQSSPLVASARSHEVSYADAVLTVSEKIAAGEGLSVEDVMRLTGRSRTAAYRLLCVASSRLPMLDTPVPGQHYRLWHRADLSADALERLLDRRA